MNGLEAEAGTLEQSGWPNGELQDTEPTHRVITRRVRDKAQTSPDPADPYDILGVRRGATASEIRAAYLQLVKELHPDGRTFDPDADERLKIINAAYRKLRAGGGERRRWAPGAVFAVGVLTSTLPLLAVVVAYYGGWLGPRAAPTPTIAAAPESPQRPEGRAGAGTTSVEKDSVAGRQMAFADAKKQATKAAWARFIADYPGGQPEAFARQAIAAIELAEAAEARRKAEQLAWRAAEKGGTRADLRQFLAKHADGELAGKARQALAAMARTEEAAWTAAERAGNSAALKRFLDEHPDADQVPRAIRALAAITAEEVKVKAEVAAWAEAERAGSKEAFQGFLDKHANAPQAPKARQALANIAEAEAKARAELESWTAAERDGSKAALHTYLSEHPAGRHAAEAKARVARLEAEERDNEAWRLALKGNTKTAYTAYLSTHPQGRGAAQARVRIAELEQAEALRRDAVKEARAGSAAKVPPSARPPRASTAGGDGGGEIPFIGADGRIRR